MNYDGDIIPPAGAFVGLPVGGKVTVMRGSDVSRTRFVSYAAKEILRVVQDQKAPALVSHLCHKSIVMEIESEMKSLVKGVMTYSIKFLESHEALGAQFPIVFVIVDLESTSVNVSKLVEIATRATVKLVILWNDVQDPYRGNSRRKFNV